MKKISSESLPKMNFPCKNKYQKVKKGFSLIEVLFSIVVLSIGIVSVLVIMGDNIKTSILAKNQIIAAQLVQEGVELVRNLNDNGDSQLVVGTSYDDYIVDKQPSSSIVFQPSGDFRLYLNGSVYSHDANGEETKFFRKIKVTDDSNQRVITSTVVWNEDGNFPADLTDCLALNGCATASSVISY
jgi:prepilin-type N-terminal cleavage/methylation domain-containing protein